MTALATPQAATAPDNIRPALVLLSRNETESLCLKAARGAGFAWGLAEEAGFAAGALASEGIDWAGPILTLLTAKLGQPTHSGRPDPSPGHWQSMTQGALCPITTGAALIDSALLAVGPFSRETRLDPVATPILLLPFLLRAAEVCARPLVISWPDGALRITPGSGFDRAAASALARYPALTLTIQPTPPEPDPTHAPPQTEPASLPPVSAAVLDALAALALRTTVPATEASRSGAGSAMTDND